MDHIGMHPNEVSVSKTYVAVALFFLLMAYGLVGKIDYATEIENERDNLRTEVIRLKGELALTQARCGNMCFLPEGVADSSSAYRGVWQ